MSEETDETDFHGWAMHQTAALRAAAAERVNVAMPIDWMNLAEEIEDLGKSRVRELRSRTVVLVHHLLKWRYQPAARSSGWRGTIVEQRQEIETVLEENPSLRAAQADILAWAYPRARVRAAVDTDMPVEAFPDLCPFDVGEVMDPGYWPEAPRTPRPPS